MSFEFSNLSVKFDGTAAKWHSSWTIRNKVSFSQLTLSRRAFTFSASLPCLISLPFAAFLITCSSTRLEDMSGWMSSRKEGLLSMKDFNRSTVCLPANNGFNQILQWQWYLSFWSRGWWCRNQSTWTCSSTAQVDFSWSVVTTSPQLSLALDELTPETELFKLLYIQEPML